MKKYEISLDVAEAHMLEEALRLYESEHGHNFETYINELRTKVNTVYERHAEAVNKK